MTELDWVREASRLIGLPRNPEIVQGIGDDCAIYRMKGAGRDLLFTTDMTLEEVHFRRATHTAKQVALKTAGRGLSDIAAMGGQPLFVLLSLAVPDDLDAAWRRDFLATLASTTMLAGAPLIGGDTARADKILCDIVACGWVPTGKALLRSGARAGNDIYVSGRLGGSALGLARGTGSAWRRHTEPQPRLALGLALREKFGATACMDLSDGLSIDLLRMAHASGLEAAVETVPRFSGASLAQALHGGEDYELLFTVQGGAVLPAEFQHIELTRIGAMVKGTPGLVRYRGKPLPPLGHDHFRS